MNNRYCLWVYVFHLTPGSAANCSRPLKGLQIKQDSERVKDRWSSSGEAMGHLVPRDPISDMFNQDVWCYTQKNFPAAGSAEQWEPFLLGHNVATVSSVRKANLYYTLGPTFKDFPWILSYTKWSECLLRLWHVSRCFLAAATILSGMQRVPLRRLQ